MKNAAPRPYTVRTDVAAMRRIVFEEADWECLEQILDNSGIKQYCFTTYQDMGSMGTMKTTLDIQDALLLRAKESARQQGRSLRSLMEQGLRQVLDSRPQRNKYRLPDLSVGQADAPDPLEEYSWQDLRALIYEDRESR